MTPEQKAELIKALIADHNQIVTRAMEMQQHNVSRVIPESVHEYTHMFLTKINDIVHG